MSSKKTLRDLSLDGRRALVRVDFNVPLADDATVADDRRIRAALPTLEYALERGASLVLMSHLGRPQGRPEERLRMDAVAEALRRCLDGRKVVKCDEVVGEEASRLAKDLAPGTVLLLENLRFHPGEKQGDAELGRSLAELGDLYVNDAFATCHRSHASMVAVPEHFEEAHRVIGLLVERELEAIERVRRNPREPLVLLVGGAKVADKVAVIESLLPQAHRVLVGGACAYPLLAERGVSIGDGVPDEEAREIARRVLELGSEKLVLPQDHVVECAPGESPREVEAIPEGCRGADIGPRTIEAFAEILGQAGSVIWSGPMGRFEQEPFDRGTRAVAETLAKGDASSLVGGGETGQAVERWGLAEAMTNVSTGGGAFLACIAGDELPALRVVPSK